MAIFSSYVRNYQRVFFSLCIMNNIHVCIYIYGLMGQNSWFWHVFPRLGISDLISCALKSVAANRFALSLSLYTYIYIHIYTYIYIYVRRAFSMPCHVYCLLLWYSHHLDEWSFIFSPVTSVLMEVTEAVGRWLAACCRRCLAGIWKPMKSVARRMVVSVELLEPNYDSFFVGFGH